MKPISPFARAWLLVAALLVALPACSQQHEAGPSTAPAAQQDTSPPHNYARWEREISGFEAQDRENPPPKGGILFTGSSTIRMWKSLAEDFPQHHVINRGFGGSEIMDATYFAERIIFPYEPKMVLIRAGTNDIHAGKSAEEVFANYQAFVAKVHKGLPKAQIVFISSAPAPSRWKERDTNKQLNTLVAKFSRGKRYLKYVETYNMSLTPDGQPRTELFISDRLHFNADGYRILAELVRPVLPK